MDLLLALLDEILEALPTVGCRSLSSEAEGDRGQNSTLATAIFTHNEVDQGTELHVKVIVTHEVVALHALEDSMLGGDIGFVDKVGVLLLNELCLTQFQLFLVFRKRIVGDGQESGRA